MTKPPLTRPEKWMVLGIPALFLLGSLWHFLYPLLGSHPLIALIAPVNESVWEHGKLALWPVTGWWLLYAARPGRRRQLQPDRWCTAALAAVAVALTAMPLLYYGYTGALGLSSLPADILIFLLALALGQGTGLHIYRRGPALPCRLSLLALAALLLAFAYLTFFAPPLPLFQDAATGQYGLG